MSDGSKKRIEKLEDDVTQIVRDAALEQFKEFVDDVNENHAALKVRLYRMVDSIVDRFFSDLSRAQNEILNSLSANDADSRVERPPRKSTPHRQLRGRGERTLLEAIQRLFHATHNEPKTIKEIIASLEMYSLHRWDSGTIDEKVKYDTVYMITRRHEHIFQQWDELRPTHYSLKEEVFLPNKSHRDSIKKKGGEVMVGPYKGNFRYSDASIKQNAPEKIGVYYIGHIDSSNKMIPDYIGSSDDIRRRVLEHLSQDDWADVTHFGYCLCSSKAEAETFEASEIKRCKPKYNKLGK